jgi:hypothetical protein
METKTNSETNAQTILRQVGTETLISVGARAYTHGDDAVAFTARRSRRVSIRLEANDTYTIEAFTIHNIAKVSTRRGVFADELAEAVEATA